MYYFSINDILNELDRLDDEIKTSNKKSTTKYVDVMTPNKYFITKETSETFNGINIGFNFCTCNKDDLSIIVEDRTIIVKSNSEFEPKNSDELKVIYNSMDKDFIASIKILSDELDLSKADACCDNGLLVISIPFVEKAEPIHIKIN